MKCSRSVSILTRAAALSGRCPSGPQEREMPVPVGFQLQFQTGLAHQIAHGQIGILFHLGAVGFGHIAEHVGEKVFFGIVAVGADHDLQAGPVDQLGLDAGHLAEIQTGDQRQGLEGLGLEAVLVVAVLELLQRRVRPLADLGQGGGDIRAVLADDGQAVGRAVVGQDIAVIVEDAPRGAKMRSVRRRFFWAWVVISGPRWSWRYQKRVTKTKKKMPTSTCRSRMPLRGGW